MLFKDRQESYQDNFWLNDDHHGTFYARGIYGQWIYIDPLTRVVIVKLSSQNTPKSVDLLRKTILALEAISRHFSK